MSENEMTVESVEESNLDIGSLWDDEDGFQADSGLEENQLQEETAEGDAPTAQDGAPTQDAPGKQEDSGTDQSREEFVLKHLDDPPRRVGRDEVITLAQKGLDYDRVQNERDQLRQYRSESEAAYEMVKRFAADGGMDVQTYIDFCHEQQLIATGTDPAMAKAQVQLDKQQAQLDAQTKAAEQERQRQEAEQRQSQERVAARQRDMEAFIKLYPGVQAQSIPNQVWEQVASGVSLVTAYTMYQNEQLRAQVAAQGQNRRNAGRAPGSMSTQGEKGPKTIADLWDEVGE